MAPNQHLTVLTGGDEDQTPTETFGWLRRQLRWESRFAELACAHADPLAAAANQVRERSKRGAA